MRTLILAVPVLVLVGGASAQPVVDSLNQEVFARSGRVAIEGSGFGTRGGTDRVEIGGIPALFTTWTDSRIVAYVPESAPIGASAVRVFAGGEGSDPFPLEVTLRSRDGRVKWTFETDGDSQWYRPAIAPDGTIYLHVSNGHVYAISPVGALEWVSHALWYPYVPPTAGPDGTVYCGSIQTVFAISRQGVTLWTYQDPDALALQNAVTVAPDGHLYGAYNLGMGAFSLSAGGDYRWSHAGDPPLFELGGPGNETIFGPSRPGGPVDQMYIGMDLRGDNHLYAFDLQGHQKWSVPVGPNSTGAEPVIGSDGALYTPDFVSGAGWVLRALEPEDGRTRWVYDGDFISACTNLEIGPDDTLYYARDLAHLEAFDPDTREVLWHTFVPGWLEQPAITPNGATLVVAGTLDGGPGFVSAFEPSNGAFRWSVALPGGFYPEERLVTAERARVTADSATAYVSTIAISRLPGDPRAVFYAVDLTDGCPADFTGDGLVDFSDYLEFLDLYDAGDLRADFTADGLVDFSDYLDFLNLYEIGC